MRDGYERFFSRFGIDKNDFFEFGLSETIHAEFEVAEKHWEDLKRRIKNNEAVYVRRSTTEREGSKNLLLQDFYRNVFNIDVDLDKAGNIEAGNVISDITSYSKDDILNHEMIRNYQVSHVFGRTKNVYAYTAPWNIVYIPKAIDPFTGHEAHGDMVEEFTNMFHEKIYSQFKPLIEDYNKLISDEALKKRKFKYFEYIERRENYEQKGLTERGAKAFVKSMYKHLDVISI